MAVERQHRQRVDDPPGRLVGRGRVVLDLHRAPVARAACRHLRQQRRGVEVDHQPLVVAEHGVELGQRPGQRTRRRRRPGTARMVRAAAARARTPRPPSAAAAGPGPRAGTPRTVSSVTTISISTSGEYGGSPQQAASSSSRTTSSSREAEAPRHLVDRGLADPGQPAHDGQQPAEAAAGVPDRGRPAPARPAVAPVGRRDSAAPSAGARPVGGGTSRPPPPASTEPSATRLQPGHHGGADRRRARSPRRDRGGRAPTTGGPSGS